MDINSEDHKVIQSFIDASSGAAAAALDELLERYPASTALRFLKLVNLEGAAFELAFKNYIKSYYIKGKPSLFKEIKDLYQNAQKANSIEKILLEVQASIEREQKFEPDDADAHPGIAVWSLMMLAQHFGQVGAFDQAI